MQHIVLRKRFVLGKYVVLGFCVALCLTFGPVRVVSAQHWWRHSGPGSTGAGADQKAEKQHAQKTQFEKPTPLYTSPKSVGWWHKSPAPMGAGADKISKLTWPNIKSTWPHVRNAQLEKPTPLYTTPKSVGWWHKSPGPAGAGSGN